MYLATFGEKKIKKKGGGEKNYPPLFALESFNTIEIRMFTKK